MKRNVIVSLSILGTVMFLCVGSVVGAPREVTSLDVNWHFHRGDIPGVALGELTNSSPSAGQAVLERAYDDSFWESVDVPHDYVVEGAFDPKAETQHGSLPVEPAWYRKRFAFTATQEDRRLWLEFDGVYRDSLIWLNGRFLGRHASGYTSFRYDVSGIARPGASNQLVVRVDPTQPEGWWYEGGGIYRHVRLVSVAPVHVAPWGVQVVAELSEPAPDPRHSARGPVHADSRLSITTTVANESDVVAHATVLSQVLDATFKLVATERTNLDLAPRSSVEVYQSSALKRAKLWSCSHPYLHHLCTSVLMDGRLVDRIGTDFGVRTIRFDPDQGFFLNGQPLKIKGVCNHQDFAGIGIAIPDCLQPVRVQKLQAMGANAWRCSHNMVASELLDACDRLGMLVMAENRHLDDSPEILGELETLVRRDRNHPSIILWSISNEEKEQGSDLGARQGRAMVDLIRRLDDRPVTAAMNNGIGHGLTGVLDVQGFNYHPDTYDDLHRQLPRKPFVATEIAAAVGTRGVYASKQFTVPKDKSSYQGDPAQCEVSAYDVNAPDWAETAEVAWKEVAKRPWMAGGFVWSGYDYRGEPTPFVWPAISSQYGILDTCGFPKDAYYYYQSWWTDEPVLHLFPHWNWKGREGEEIPVWVYSNCDSVELFLNGVSLGAQSMQANSHLEWKMKYLPGKLVAKGKRKGKRIQTTVETTGEPAAIVLEPDRSRLAGDGADISLVTVRIVDDQGRTVPNATNLVNFSLRGPGFLLGVGNGDPGCHQPDKASSRSAFNGLCLAVVQSSADNGTITLRADSPSLKSATALIKAGKSLPRSGSWVEGAGGGIVQAIPIIMLYVVVYGLPIFLQGCKR